MEKVNYDGDFSYFALNHSRRKVSSDADRKTDGKYKFLIVDVPGVAVVAVALLFKCTAFKAWKS